MTHKQRAVLDAALGRAERQGIRIMGQGTRRADGARVYAVTSASQPLCWYLVAIEGDRLHCDCPARGICKHRAAVHQRLLEDHAATQAAEARQAALEAERAAERTWLRELALEANDAALAPSL